jgi:hypothetical protein
VGLPSYHTCPDPTSVQFCPQFVRDADTQVSAHPSDHPRSENEGDCIACLMLTTLTPDYPTPGLLKILESGYSWISRQTLALTLPGFLQIDCRRSPPSPPAA